MLTTHQKYHFDPAQLRDWYHDQGLSVRQIGALTGASFKTIQRHLVDAGIPRRMPSCNPPPSKSNPVTEQEVAAWKAAFDADPDLGLEDAAAQFGRAPSTINRYLAGLPQSPRRRRKTAWALDRQRVRELHAQGLRGIEIDRALGWRMHKAVELQQELGLPAEHAIPDAATLKRLYTEMRDAQKVARHLRVDTARVRDALHSAGIELGSARRKEGPGSKPGTTAARVWQALSEHPEGLATPQIAKLACDPGLPDQRAQSLCGTILRRLEAGGLAARAGFAAGTYHNVRSVIWRLVTD